MATNYYDEDVKKRQGNYIEDFNNLPQFQEEQPQEVDPNRVVVQPSPKSRSQQILESIYANAAPPPPVYNEALQKRREKVARLNAAGRGFNVLGDVLSLATGANVQKRQPDQVTPAMLNSYQNYIQDYDNRMDRFNYQNYRDNLANKRLLYSDAVRQEDLQREEKRYQDAQNWKKLGFKTEQEWREFQKERAAKDDELQKERLEWQKQAPYVQHKLMTEREQQEAQNRLQYMMSKAAFDQAKDGFILYDDAGNPVKSIDKGMMNRLVKTILQDPATAKFAENDLQFMKGSFEGLSTNAMNSIIGFYWDKSPMARELLKIEEPKQSSIPSNWQAPRPAYQGPVREGTQQPTQAPAQQSVLPENDINNPDPLGLGL